MSFCEFKIYITASHLKAGKSLEKQPKFGENWKFFFVENYFFLRLF
jgi:hypothetical protein